jgi:hypothetical protein
MEPDIGDLCEPCDAGIFVSLLMKIAYAAHRTRPDVVFAVNVLSSKVKSPTKGDMKKLNRIVDYLRGTVNDGVRFVRGSGKVTVVGSFDAAFSTHGDMKSHSGAEIRLDEEGSASIYVKSGKQSTVADSSTEAELISSADGVKPLVYVLDIVHELCTDVRVRDECAVMYQDNQATIRLNSDKPANFKGKSKYIRRKYFVVYEYVEEGKVKMVYIGTDHMVADFLTKALNGEKFRRFKAMLMGMNLPKPEAGLAEGKKKKESSSRSVLCAWKNTEQPKECVEHGLKATPALSDRFK